MFGVKCQVIKCHVTHRHLTPDTLSHGLVAQRLAQGTHNSLVAGSNPAGPTSMNKYISIAKHSLFMFFIIGCIGIQTPLPEISATKPDIDFSNIIVSLTFDDGNADNYLISSVLQEKGLHATFYVSSGLTGKEGFMTVEQLRKLYEDGNEIGGHTLDHASLLNIEMAKLRDEVCRDRKNLLGMGFDTVSFAYPFGEYDSKVIQVVKDCGYNTARTVADGPQELPIENYYTLNAMPYIVQDTTFQKMTRYLKDVQREGGGWAIFTFHHVCDGCNKFSVSYDTFVHFLDWLSYQREMNGLRVLTVREVVGGDVKPVIYP